MIEIIPVLNVKTFPKLQKHLSLLKKYKGLLQLDVADGKFTTWKNFHDIAKIKLLKIKNPIEIHLMINDPETYIQDWLFLKPKRIITHIEVIKDFNFLYNTTKKAGVELGLAISPETSTKQLYPYINKTSFVLILGVVPGPSGQEFETYVLNKIKELKRKYPKVKIEADGGINLENAKTICSAGADYLAVGSYIFDAPKPLEALELLKQSLQTQC